MPIVKLRVKDWNRHRHANEIHRGALERLYARWDRLNDVICSLESYQRLSTALDTPIPIGTGKEVVVDGLGTNRRLRDKRV